MGARWVLLAFGLLYALVGIAISPAHGRIAPLDEWIWDTLTLGSFALLLALQNPAQWLADALGISGQTAVLGIVVVVCLALAALAIWRLARKGGKAFAAFLLMLAVSVPAAIVLSLYEFSTLGH
jgi:ABC-type maltose transport system permease subunit